MKLCNETVTVFNARVDPATREVAFAPTVLRGVSWHGETLSAVAENGLKAANRYTLRIPTGVDAGGKAWAEPRDYRQAGDVAALWTLQTGDVIALGEAAELSPDELRRQGRAVTVLGVTDNRGAARARHWKVTGA